MKGLIRKSVLLPLLASVFVSGCSISVGVKEERKYGTSFEVSMIRVFIPTDIYEYVHHEKLDDPKDVTLSNSLNKSYTVKDAVYFGESEFPGEDGTYKIRYAINSEEFGGELSFDKTGCKEYFVDHGVITNMEACGINIYHVRGERISSQKRAYISFD
ncbi:hypothetical protein [Vibrio parahaemolyticus]